MREEELIVYKELEDGQILRDMVWTDGALSLRGTAGARPLFF